VRALEADAASAQRADLADQVGQRPGQPVQARHYQGVAGPQVVQAGGQLGPGGTRATWATPTSPGERIGGAAGE
jgi:hypothetical protein